MPLTSPSIPGTAPGTSSHPGAAAPPRRTGFGGPILAGLLLAGAPGLLASGKGPAGAEAVKVDLGDSKRLPIADIPAGDIGNAAPAAGAGKSEPASVEETMAKLLEELKGFEPPADLRQWRPPESTNWGLPVRGLFLRPFRDFSGAALDRANLRKRDIRHAILDRGNLCGADLDGTLMSGTRLHGARLWGANRGQAVDLDPAGALPHPYFRPGIVPGDIRILRLNAAGLPEQGAPRSLVRGLDGTLYWLEGEAPVLQSLAPCGLRTRLPLADDTRLFALAVDTGGRIWCFGDRLLTLFDPARPSRRGMAPLHRMPSPGTPLQVVADSTGDILASFRGMPLVMRYRPEIMKVQYETLKPIKPKERSQSKNLRLFAGRDGNRIYLDDGYARLLVYTPRGERIALSAGQNSTPLRGLAFGADTDLWVTIPGLDSIALFDLASDQSLVIPLGEAGGPPVEPWGITLDADGALWITERRAGRIRRIRVRDQKTMTWQLPPGHHPEEICAGPDGWVRFTLQGMAALGAIRAQEAWPDGADGKAGEPAGAGDAKGSGGPALGPEGPARPAGDCRLETQAQSVPGAPAGEPGQAATAAAPGGEALRGALARLAALPQPVRLDGAMLQRILADPHRSHPDCPERYRFRSLTRFIWEDDDFEGAIADGLERAGGVAGPLAKAGGGGAENTFEVLDLCGRNLTIVRCPDQVSTWEDEGKLRTTRCMAVVTEPVPGAGRGEHVVVDVVPVPES